MLASPFSLCMSLILCLCLTLGSALPAADPEPTHAAISYGPHPHQLLDVYLPPGEGPFPVLIWYGRLWEPGVPCLRSSGRSSRAWRRWGFGPG